jgi:hypothetical protein
MRWAKLLVTTWVLAGALQLLLGQAVTSQIRGTDADKAKQFEVARASGFDFSKLSAPRSLFPQVIWSNQPQTLAAASGKDGDLCYTMRVYKFSHEDDEPPRMTGSTTCTPANRVGLKSAIVSRPAAR